MKVVSPIDAPVSAAWSASKTFADLTGNLDPEHPMHPDRLPDPTPSNLAGFEIAEEYQARNPGRPLPTHVHKQIEAAELQKFLERAEQQYEHARNPVSGRRAARRVRELEAAIREVWPQAYPCVEGDGPPPGPDDATCPKCGRQISRQQKFEGTYCGICASAGRSTTDQERKP